MSNKRQELIKILRENPDRELIFLYPEEGSDHRYTMGFPSRILIDEYWIDDDRVWLRYDDEDEMFDWYSDEFFDELFPNEMSLNDEQAKIVTEKTREFINSRNWVKCVCVYINY